MYFFRITALIFHPDDHLTILVLVRQHNSQPEGDASFHLEGRRGSDLQIFDKRELTIKVLKSNFPVLELSIELLQLLYVIFLLLSINRKLR